MPDTELLRLWEDENGALHAKWGFDNRHNQYRLLAKLLGSVSMAEDEDIMKAEGSGLLVPPSGLILPGGH